MEEGFYEVDVNSLEVNTLYNDGNVTRKAGSNGTGELNCCLGAHGKGLYSGQGVMVYSNNGETGEAALERFDVEAGALYEWDGKDWKLIRRNQFVEVTGPGGIYGNANPETDPIWATGWDHKSVLVVSVIPKPDGIFTGCQKQVTVTTVLTAGIPNGQEFRDIGTTEMPDYLMTMHGMFWRFPRNIHC